MLLDDVGFQSSCRHIVVMTDFDGCDHASLKRYSTESSAGPPESRKHWLHLCDGASLDRISAEAALGWVTSTGRHFVDEGSDWTLGECVFQTLAVVSGQKPMA